jgi:hypothetical protein
MTFSSEVAKAFGFLVSEHGFQFTDIPDSRAGEMVEYRKEPLTIAVGWYKGEVDVGFSVALEFASNHKVFRPYLSRTFQLREVALAQDPAAFVSWATRQDLGGFVTRAEQAAPYLNACAEVMRKYCGPVLAGDLSLLERITLERKERAARPARSR